MLVLSAIRGISIRFELLPWCYLSIVLAMKGVQGIDGSIGTLQKVDRSQVLEILPGSAQKE